mmetsp:Transcript_72430/g.223771  ORF Transcript_72430/g.223771 Transcript_72430/m.223771 type:complete len:295 (+) Transcript_72430:613-1497(+)
MLRRARVHGPDHELQLREHGLCGLRAAADKVQHADALPVEPQVLREGLAHHHLEPAREEEPDGKGVLVQAAGGVALVGAVHEGEELARLHDLDDLPPLLLRGVHARGVVGAGVQEDQGALRRALQRVHHAREVQRLGVRLVVGVGLDRKARLREDGVVVAPGRVRDPDLVHRRRHVGLHKLGGHAERAGARERLDGGDAALLHGVALAKDELLRERLELSGTVDGAVFLVDAASELLEHLVLGLLDHVQDKGLALLRPVGADTQIHLSGVLVGIEQEGCSQDRVDGRLRDVAEQ